jgi:hypothetical protein
MASMVPLTAVPQSSTLDRIMERNDIRGCKNGLAVFVSAVAVLMCGTCGRTSVFDGRKDSSVPGAASKSQGDSRLDDQREGGSGNLVMASEAVVEPGCSPNDAPAVSIHFGVDRPACDGARHGSYVVVSLWQTSWDHLRPGTYDLGSVDALIGMAVFGSGQGADDSQLANSGALTIDSVDSTRMTGHLALIFPSGTLSLDFTAWWCGGYELCG